LKLHQTSDFGTFVNQLFCRKVVNPDAEQKLMTGLQKALHLGRLAVV
jgi:hypothetical protein